LINFASFELGNCAKEIIFPFLRWKKHCKESANQAKDKLKKFMLILDKQLSKKKYIWEDTLTLEDVSLFRHFKLFFQFVFGIGSSEKVFPKVATWFTTVSQTHEVRKVFGKVLFCESKVKAYTS